MRNNVTVTEIAEANNLKPAEANALIKLLEHFGVATKTGFRKDETKGKGKRPSEYSIGSNFTMNVSETRAITLDIPESEVYREPVTSDVEETEKLEVTNA